ncbi:MAG TPA: tyrosine-type recombinase/integrase [Chthoniobacteraceae bacterium]|jgi:integrase
MKPPSTDARPHELKVGKIVFPLCERADGRFVSWWKSGTKRNLVSAVSMPKLKAKLEAIAVQIINGNIDGAQLDASDHRTYIAAREALRPHKIPVDIAARDYAAARAMLGEVPLLDAVRFYQRNAGSEIIEKLTREVILEFSAAKTAQELSESYRDQIRKDLARFSERFGEHVLGDVKSSDIDAYLDTLGHVRRKLDGKKVVGKVFVPASGWRRNQVRNTIATLFAFARDRHFLPQEKTTQAERVTRRKTVSHTSPVYTPDQLRIYLEATREHAREWLPWLAIGAFTGMRTGAILRLHWRDVHWDQGVIEVTAGNSKIGRRYLAPLHAALVEWLEPWRHTSAAHGSGRVVPASPPVAKLTAKLTRWTCIKWRKNALRSSFISYRMAETGDPVLVARECNTSATEVSREYQDIRTLTGEFVTKELAAEWFGVRPPLRGKVVEPQFRFA